MKQQIEEMRKFITYIPVILITFLFSACELIVDVVTDDTTDMVTHTVDYPLTSLLLKKDMDLEIVESDDMQIVVVAAKALLEEFRFYVDSGKVTLYYDKYNSWMYDKPKVQLRVPSACRIELYADNALHAPDTLYTENIDIFSDGTNDIHLKVNCRTLHIFGTNVSNFHISGQAKRTDVTTTHGSIFYGAHLLSDSVICNLNGSNIQIVNPREFLHCNVNYSGNIYYVNEPEELTIQRTENGSGQVIYDPARTND